MAQKEIPADSIKKPFSGNDDAQQIYRVAGYAFLLNFLLAIMKALLAFFSGSLAITASAIDSGTDAVASLMIYGGVKLSTKKRDRFQWVYINLKTSLP